MNKSLDYNKLMQAHTNGKLLKKKPTFPIWTQIKYDGNYTTIIIDSGAPLFISSGSIEYLPTNDTIFDNAPDGVYLVERIGTDGKLGDRTRCSLRGPDGAKIAVNHRYMVHDMLTIDEYKRGAAGRPYHQRYRQLCSSLRHHDDIVNSFIVSNQEELDQRLREVTDQGFEGLMMKDPGWFWADTNSRTDEFLKYKKRPTVDLMCVGWQKGEGKYTGMIGALLLEDSEGRQVFVGAGLSDTDRAGNPNRYVGRVIEIEYEQILKTYIQPVFITIREDKEID